MQGKPRSQVIWPSEEHRRKVMATLARSGKRFAPWAATELYYAALRLEELAAEEERERKGREAA